MGRKSEPQRRIFDPPAVRDAIRALADDQHAVFALWQLAARGLSPRAAQRRAASSGLYRIHQGVYSLVPESLLTPMGRRMAAVLACGPGAALSLYSAAKHRGLMDSSRPYIDVTVPTRGGRSRDGIRIHRSLTLRPQDIERVERIPCTTVARTLFDLAEVLTPRRLERLLDEAEYQQVLDLTALGEQIGHGAGRPKAGGRLKRALSGHRAGSTLTDGPIGEATLALIRRTPGLAEPKVQHYIDLQDGEPMICTDFAWPEAKVILETDGNQAHGAPRRRRADYRRDQRAARAGWYTVRADWQQITAEPDGLSQTLVELVTSRWGLGAA